MLKPITSICRMSLSEEVDGIMENSNENGNWFTIATAMRQLSVSRRTIERRIKDSKYSSKLMDNGRRLVYLDDATLSDIAPTNDGDSVVWELRQQNEHLRQQNESLMHQIEQLTGELTESHQVTENGSLRHDTIVLQITQQLDRAHMQIEDLRQKRSWWRQMFSR